MTLETRGGWDKTARGVYQRGDVTVVKHAQYRWVRYCFGVRVGEFRTRREAMDVDI